MVMFEDTPSGHFLRRFLWSSLIKTSLFGIYKHIFELFLCLFLILLIMLFKNIFLACWRCRVSYLMNKVEKKVEKIEVEPPFAPTPRPPTRINNHRIDKKIKRNKTIIKDRYFRFYFRFQTLVFRKVSN